MRYHEKKIFVMYEEKSWDLSHLLYYVGFFLLWENIYFNNDRIFPPTWDNLFHGTFSPMGF